LINSEAIVRSIQFNKLQTESETKKQILKAEQQLALKQQQGEMNLQDIQLQIKKKEAENL
jgi:hypothetical protein